MKIASLSKIGRLGVRIAGDILAPYRFGFNRESVHAASTGRWLYSLNYTRRGMIRHYDMKKDGNGIVMMSHYVDHAQGGHYYSPVKIAHYALGAWNDCIHGDRAAMEDFKKYLDWLRSRQESFGGCTLWRTPTSNPRYDLPSNYPSAIVQGLILSVLARSVALKDDPETRRLIEGTVALFHCPVEDGGILASSPFGTFYEEYPCVPYSHVVNGFMFSLNGLWDAAQIGSATALERYNAAIETLPALLSAWITNRWSYYDLRHLYLPEKRNLATRHYQYLHIDQLQFFNTVDGNNRYDPSITKLRHQMRNPANWFLAYTNKFRGLIGKTVRL